MKLVVVGLVMVLGSLARADGNRHVVSQAVDANILPAVTVDVAAPSGRWSSTGTDLVGEGPTAQLNANVAFVMRPETRVVGPRNVAVKVGDFGGIVRGAAAKSVVLPSVIDQIVDFGLPSLTAGAEWHVEVGYTILPAGV